jgi:hypothetical protein
MEWIGLGIGCFLGSLRWNFSSVLALNLPLPALQKNSIEISHTKIREKKPSIPSQNSQKKSNPSANKQSFFFGETCEIKKSNKYCIVAMSP